MIKKISMCALALVAGAHFSFAQTTISITASKDNTIYEDVTGQLSNGAGDGMVAGNDGGGDTKRALLSFDLSSIPAGATITKVTVNLYLNKGKTNADNVTLHKLNKDWGEGTSNANGGPGEGDQATTGDATWLHNFYDTDMWTTAGGDYEATASATLSLKDVAGIYGWTSAQMLTDVEAWIANPTSNFGWILIGNESKTSTTRHFSSREAADEAQRPTLVVEYTEDKSSIARVSADVFTIYPNPFNNQVQINTNGYDGIMTVKVLNTNMQEVYLSNTIQSGDYIELSDLENGLYFIIIETKEGTITKKITKIL